MVLPKQDQSKKILAEIQRLRGEARNLEDGLARLEEIVASGETSTSALMSEFVSRWEKRTGDRYVGAPGRDMGQMRALLKQLPPEEIRVRMDRYFMLTEAFYQKCGWSLGVFVKAINSLGEASQTHVEGRTTSGARAVAGSLSEDGWFGDV